MDKNLINHRDTEARRKRKTKNKKLNETTD